MFSLSDLHGVELKGDEINHRVAGVDCWPIIKVSLLSSGQHGRHVFQFQNNHSRLFSLAVAFAKCLRGFFLLPFMKKADVFILSDSKFSEKINGELYLKDSHAFAEIFERSGKTSTIALQNQCIDDALVRKGNCFSVYFVLFLAAIMSRLYFLMSLFPGLSKYLDKMLRCVGVIAEKKGGYFDACKVGKILRKNILFCIIASILFRILLRRVRPGEVYVVCFYSLLGMSLCAACHCLGIPTADIQHGVSGRNMRAYGGWRWAPKFGYTTLPDKFLTWTEYDAGAINEHLQSRNGMHQAIKLTDSWRSFKDSSGLHAVSKGEWHIFLNSILSFRRKIVLTLQSPVVPPDLRRLIDTCGDDCCFLIRVHPDFTSSMMDFELFDLPKKYRNVFVAEPSLMPIQTLMSFADVNITGWSASVYDAYFEGVRSVVISDLGRDYFVDFIRDGFVMYASNFVELKCGALTLTKFSEENLVGVDQNLVSCGTGRGFYS